MKLWSVLGIGILFAGTLWSQSTETIFLRGDQSPANEVPAVTGVTASGRATINLHVNRDGSGEVVSGTVDFDIDYTFGSSVTVTGLHIHDGAAGVNGPVVIPTDINSTTNAIAAQGSGNIFKTVSVTGGNALTALRGVVVNPANYYVNLHTSVNPGGLMRDQLRVAPPPPPAFSDGASVLNNASYVSGSSSLAPGSIVAIFGTRLTDGTSCLQPACYPTLDSNGKVNTTLSGVQVTVNGIAAPILYTRASPGQLGIQIPYEVSGTTATVQVTVAGQSSAAKTVSLSPASPGLFTANQGGTGAAAVKHSDGTTDVTAQNPARPGEVVIFYATGLGQVTPAVATGALATGSTSALVKPTVTIDGLAAEVQYWGLSGCCAGLNQLNVVVPAAARSASDLSVVLSSGGVQANPVTIAVGTTPPPSSSNPVPAISSLLPATVDAGSQARTLTINGTGFIAGSTVTFNGVPKTVTFISQTQLTLPLTAGDLAAAGSFTVVVSNPAPGGGNSNGATLTVVSSAPPDPYDYY